MAYDVFISYSHVDKLVADAVCANLEMAGIRCWIAPRDIAPGEDWPTAISKAIAASRVMALIFSANSNSSEDVGRELILAANNKVIIVPFKIDDIVPEPGKQYYLARTHWLDAMNPPTQEQIDKLADCVSTFLFGHKVLKREEPAKPAVEPASEKPAVKSETISLKEVKVTAGRKKYWIIGITTVCLAAAGIGAMLWFGRNNKTAAITTDIPPSPTFTVTDTPSPTSTITPIATTTVTPQPAWVADFAEPILVSIEDHYPRPGDDFNYPTRGWFLKSDCTENEYKFVDGELITSCGFDCTYWLTDFVMKFDWRAVNDPSTDGLSIYFREFEGFGFNQGGVERHGSLKSYTWKQDQVGDPYTQVLIIVKDQELALYVEDQPVYYGKFDGVYEEGNIFWTIGGTVAINSINIWDLNDIVN